MMLKLHCFSQSGNAYKDVFALNAMGLAWQPVFVDFMHGATRDPDWREQSNIMGEVPILGKYWVRGMVTKRLDDSVRRC